MHGESFRVKSVVKEELILFYNEGVSYLYTSAADTHRPISSRQQQSAAAAVAMDVSYPHSGPSGVWQQNSPLGLLNSNERWRIDVVSHSGSGAKISGGLAGCGKSGNGWMCIAVDKNASRHSMDLRSGSIC